MVNRLLISVCFHENRKVQVVSTLASVLKFFYLCQMMIRIRTSGLLHETENPRILKKCRVPYKRNRRKTYESIGSELPTLYL